MANVLDTLMLRRRGTTVNAVFSVRFSATLIRRCGSSRVESFHVETCGDTFVSPDAGKRLFPLNLAGAPGVSRYLPPVKQTA